MENLNLEALLECYGKLPEVNDESIKEYLEIVKKLKMFVKAAEKTATSPETVPVVKAIMVTMEGIFQEYRSQDYAATMKSTLADLKGIKDQLAQQDSQDLETVWACIEGVCEKVKSTFGLETTNIRNESNGNPMQGIECVSEKLKGMHQTFITRQINWQMGMSAFLGLSTFIECWTTFTILDKFSIENSLYDKKLQEITETLSEVEQRVISLSNDISKGQAVNPITVERLLAKLQRAREQLDTAKELLQANKNNVSLRRTAHVIGTVASLVATYRSISEYFMACSAGLNPALTVASAAICGVSAIAHGAMAYQCHKAIAEADALLKKMKAHEERLARVAQATQDFLSLLQEKINSAKASKSPATAEPVATCQQGGNPLVVLGLAILAVAVVWRLFT